MHAGTGISQVSDAVRRPDEDEKASVMCKERNVCAPALVVTSFFDADLLTGMPFSIALAMLDRCPASPSICPRKANPFDAIAVHVCGDHPNTFAKALCARKY